MRRGLYSNKWRSYCKYTKKILDGWDKIIGEKFFLEDDFSKISEISKKVSPSDIR